MKTFQTLHKINQMLIPQFLSPINLAPPVPKTISDITVALTFGRHCTRRVFNKIFNRQEIQGQTTRWVRL